MNVLNLDGQTYGRLTVKSSYRENNVTYCNCVCECSKECIVRSNKLRTGMTRSCGCLREEVIKKGGNFRHGLDNSPEHNSWVSMKNRCNNPNNRSYKNYGGRGITVCERWMESFDNFMKDMGNKPGDQYSIDRRNNNAGYCKDNCKWSDKKEQANNRRPKENPPAKTKALTINGETRLLEEWYSIYGTDRVLYYTRKERGWDEIEAISTPRNSYRKR